MLEHYSELRKHLDNSPWERKHTLMILSVASSFFLWGVILAIAPLVTTWYFIPPSADEYILIASPVGLLLGNYIMGLLSDRFGRKPAYVLTLVPTAVGLLLITLSFSWLPIAIGIFLSEFGIGGDETVSLSLMGEMLPLRHRGRAIVSISNIANISITLISLLFLLQPRVSSSVFVEKEIFGAMVAVSLAIAIGSRFYLPESERWAYLNRNGEGERPMNWLTFAALSLFAITIIVGFPLTALVIGPFQFPQYTDTFEFLVTLAESVTGVVFGLLLAERISRKSGSLIAYTGGFVSILLIVLFLRSLTLALFLVILVVNGVFGEIGWAEREMLEPESFFTPRRGRAIGYVRMVGYAVYVVTIPLLARAGEFEYFVFTCAIFLLGFIGALLYFLGGRETRGISLE
ncbi:MFS transporter [Thermogymnomonas acidicola]|uniref:MFS transporter n=1 Tax=Thermogymnomonas acidicola TaxID=399579 RepID=A0AA37BQ47_9ARCH|nr:MFS transporter [Thermogymnomonas acidicola]GGM66146.1 MFS transporter [Thermogymnomonas acidicola]